MPAQWVAPRSHTPGSRLKPTTCHHLPPAPPLPARALALHLRVRLHHGLGERRRVARALLCLIGTACPVVCVNRGLHTTPPISPISPPPVPQWAEPSPCPNKGGWTCGWLPACQAAAATALTRTRATRRAPGNSRWSMPRARRPCARAAHRTVTRRCEAAISVPPTGGDTYSLGVPRVLHARADAHSDSSL
jgi:hypothetical protein